MRSLTLGIVAHVDAGKTSLTERLLYEAGVIAEPGSVDAGTTLTDSMALERRRGITIRASVTSFDVGDIVVNLVDTPGHPDFIAEVERSLGILEGAIVVVSAVEGVQAQTTVLVRALQRLDVPFVYFLNKIDRTGADPDRVAGQLAARFHSGSGVPPIRVGSATKGIGVAELLDEIPRLLPAPGHDATAPLAGTVFKVERDTHRVRMVYVLLQAGTLRVRDRVSVRAGESNRVTGIQLFDRGRTVSASRLDAGRVAVVQGLHSARIGDVLGGGRSLVSSFRPPSLEAVVEPIDDSARPLMRTALAELADQDPLIGVRHDDARTETSVTLYGDVQREVLAARLSEDYGVGVAFSASVPICIERVLGTGEAVEWMTDPGNPFLAAVGLRVSPVPPGEGIGFDIGAARGRLPSAFVAAIEEGVRATLKAGPHGWAIPDCRVRITETHYWPRQGHAHQKFDKASSSTAGDFRALTPLVLMAALRSARTVVCEPIAWFELEAPVESVSAVLALLSSSGGIPSDSARDGDRVLLSGDVPVGALSMLHERLPGLTSGEGVLLAEPRRFDPVVGSPPRRSRVDDDPTDRVRYLQVAARRIGRV